jgi:hypothetical protein
MTWIVGPDEAPGLIAHRDRARRPGEGPTRDRRERSRRPQPRGGLDGVHGDQIGESTVLAPARVVDDGRIPSVAVHESRATDVQAGVELRRYFRCVGRSDRSA